ncbi:TetR family transcriptional regulator [Paractinoplanes abujensis]|uniref:AcrR family transcriptional regulator n=1 Tax=Paractinoplanes abujensis TaxID=882441 RepID=A0A7W7CYD1_9ACTN|nr:TetR/AcrR family transcriptional regulator [Actinoplanes abujensis]MBB4696930.1 AcrR family transcriptional regulator [Actinoplanes abujensis]GID18598.1 TetR family transcriptional regulator [Actinoplanes abujensis]
MTDTRDRLLDAAADLFYREGLSVGVEALTKAAGVSKRSMYQLFGSKDEVVAASLDRIGPGFNASLLPGDDVAGPRERILHVFRVLDEVADRPGFHGCPFVATSIEIKAPDHPARAVARRYKDGLTAFFRHEATVGGAAEPERLARQLTMTFDGASAWAVMHGDGLGEEGLRMAETLCDAAGLRAN